MPAMLPGAWITAQYKNPACSCHRHPRCTQQQLHHKQLAQPPDAVLCAVYPGDQRLYEGVLDHQAASAPAIANGSERRHVCRMLMWTINWHRHAIHPCWLKVAVGAVHLRRHGVQYTTGTATT